jgi:hypothetical protein
MMKADITAADIRALIKGGKDSLDIARHLTHEQQVPWTEADVWNLLAWDEQSARRESWQHGLRIMERSP